MYAHAAHRSTAPHASFAASALLAIAFFLLSADLLHVVVAGNKVKYGYFAIIGMWLTAPGPMRDAALSALRRAPRWPLLLLAPLAISVATSAAVGRSLGFVLWLGFDAFTVLTIYAFLVAHRFRPQDVAACATAALFLIASVAIVQFIAIHFLQRIVLTPQHHFDLYRINGVAGWPHFLCIFSFLLLPLVVTQERPSLATKVVVALLMFALVQSTAKTGWVLFLCLGSLMLWFDRATFTRNFMFLLLPATVAALLLPAPAPPVAAKRDAVAPPATVAVDQRASAAPQATAEHITGSEKFSVFSDDLDITRGTTSGYDRVLIGEMGLAVFARHPWFGVGPRAYATYVGTRFDAELPGVNKIDANGNVNMKHENIWIEWLAECGALFTAGFALLLCRTLRVPGFVFRNRLHFGSFIALVLYFLVSGQVSQNGLLTLAYAVLGVFLYARDQRPVAKSDAFTRSRLRVPYDASSLTDPTRPHA